MSLWAEVDPAVRVPTLAAEALRPGVGVYEGQRFAFDDAPLQALRLGYGALDSTGLREAAKRLGAAARPRSTPADAVEDTDDELRRSVLPGAGITRHVEHGQNHDEVGLDGKIHGVGKSPEKCPAHFVAQDRVSTSPDFCLSYHANAASTSRSASGCDTKRYKVSGLLR